jgi:hypothetical protein
MTYHLQFFRQWLRDIGVDDIETKGSLDHAKALAQVTLETLARERTSRFRPRTAFVIDAETREVMAVYRLTDDGPVEMPLGAKPPAKPAAPASHLRVVSGGALTAPPG